MILEARDFESCEVHKVKLTDMEKDLIIHRFGINNSDILTL